MNERKEVQGKNERRKGGCVRWTWMDGWIIYLFNCVFVCLSVYLFSVLTVSSRVRSGIVGKSVGCEGNTVHKTALKSLAVPAASTTVECVFSQESSYRPNVSLTLETFSSDVVFLKCTVYML